MPESRLLHREHDLAAIGPALQGLGQGRPAVVLIQGPRGIGKSALLQLVLARFAGDALVLRARCHENEQGFPYGVVRQLFDPFTDRSGQGDSGIPGEGPGDVPGTVAADPAGGILAAALPDQGAIASEHRLLDGFFSAARSLTATRPVVIAIDDLHLADAPSKQWCSYLARRLDGLPVALVVTLDTDDPDPLCIELGLLASARTLNPEPLCDSCTSELAAEAFGSPLDTELAALCHTLSRGNPLVLEELTTRLLAARVSPLAPDLDAVLGIGARTLADTTLAWLRQSRPGALDLLTCLAVLGPGAGLGTAATLAGQGELVAGESREALRRSGLIGREQPDAIRHGLVRTAVLGSTGADELIRLHERAGALLVSLGAPAAQVAEHLMSSGTTGLDWALPVLRRAAREATEDGRWDDAARFLHRALAEAGGGTAAPAETAEAAAVRAATVHEATVQLGAVELHRDLAACARYAGTVAAALPDPVDRARTLQVFASPVLVLAAPSAAEPFAEAATALAAMAAPPRDLLLAISAQAMLVGHRPGVRQAVATLRAGSPDLAEQGFLGALAAMTAAGGRAHRRAVRLALRCVQSASTAEAGIGVVGAAMALAWTGRLDEAGAWAGRVVRSAQRWNRPAELALALLTRSDIAFRQGHLDLARSDAAAAAELADRVAAPGLLIAARALEVRLALRAGQEPDPESLRALADLPADSHPLVRGTVLEARGLAAAARGDHTEALRLHLECGHQLAVRGIANPSCVPWRAHAAQAYQALGEHAAARTITVDPVPGAEPRRGTLTEHGPAIGSRDAGPVRLTPGERRVTELVLQGLSNLEVAERLCLSKRTVDTHLGRIYRKLAIKGRPELASAVRSL